MHPLPLVISLKISETIQPKLIASHREAAALSDNLFQLRSQAVLPRTSLPANLGWPVFA